MAPPEPRHKKRTIDRRRHRKKVTTTSGDDDVKSVLVLQQTETRPTPPEPNNNDDEEKEVVVESIVPANKNNKTDSSDDDDEDMEEFKSDSSSSEAALPTTNNSAIRNRKTKKMTVRSASRAAPKRKKLILAKRSPPPPRPTKAKKRTTTKKKKEEEASSSDEEGNSSDHESNVSEFEPEDNDDDDVQDDQSDDDSEQDLWDSDEQDKMSRRPKRQRRAQQKPAARASRSSRNHNTQKQSRYSVDSSDSTEAEEVTQKKKRAKRPARGSQNNEKNDESDSSEASSSEEEEEVGKPKRSGVRKPAPTRRRPTNTRESEESSDSDTEEEVKYSTPAGYTRPRKRRSPVAFLGSSEDEEDDSPRRSTPSRRSAARALSRIHDVVEKDEIVEKEERADRSTRKKQRRMDEDEEFDPDASDEPEEDVEDGSGDGDSSVLSDATDADDDRQNKIGNVDAEQDFLTADSSDDEAAAGPSPMLNVKYTPQSRRLQVEQDSFDSSSSESEFDQNQDEPMLSSSPHMPPCPSETDAITIDPLPDKHVCFLAPDQQMRQCFALETLHKIAMNSNHRGPDGKRTFLQPPHFRTQASDDFIDQIASRFGRSALDLDGDFYRRGHINIDGYTLTFGANLENEAAFQERLNTYMRNLMGSQDVYCCPLCYIESHRKLVHRFDAENADSSDDSAGEEAEANNHEPIKLWHDPMTVLGFVDDEDYKLASAFCFTKVADVKRHLRDAHNVDTKAIQGNDMYARFKVRAADGLLQRYIDRVRHGHSFQGDMRRYWNLGNNSLFVYLLHLMKRREALRERLDAGEDESGEALLFFDDTQDFYQSFESRVQRTWDTLSAPYRKASKEELKQFIEEGDVDEDDSQPHFLLQRQMNELTPEDEVAEALKQRRMSQGDEQHSEISSEDHHDDDDSALGDDSDDYEHNEHKPEDEPGYYSEEEEETDEWVTSKLARRHGRAKKSPATYYSPPSKTGKRLGRARGKKNGQLKRDPDSPDRIPLMKTKKAKVNMIILDSDSDE